jgi:hypothetical protein
MRKVLPREKQRSNQESPGRVANPQSIKQIISTAQNLHVSFWENPRFIRWRLMRLNEAYRKDVLLFWSQFWALDRELPGKLFHPELVYETFPALLKKVFDTCLKTTNSSKPSFADILYSQRFRIDDVFKIIGDFPPRPQQTFVNWHEECSRVSNIHLDLICTLRFFKDMDGVVYKIEVPFENPQLFSPLPLPWFIRFPLPFFLDKIPPWPPEWITETRRQDFALNLLVYELSQAGIKPKRLADLLRTECPNMLYGVVKDYNGTSGKDPLLSRLYTIKMSRGTLIHPPREHLNSPL